MRKSLGWGRGDCILLLPCFSSLLTSLALCSHGAESYFCLYQKFSWRAGEMAQCKSMISWVQFLGLTVVGESWVLWPPHVCCGTYIFPFLYIYITQAYTRNKKIGFNVNRKEWKCIFRSCFDPCHTTSIVKKEQLNWISVQPMNV